MLDKIFESRERAHRDQLELRNLQSKHGQDVLNELKQRAKDASLARRDRKHWQRLLRKARRLEI